MNAFLVSVTYYTLIFRCLFSVFFYRSSSLFRFSIKCFYSQFTGSKVFLNLSSISRLDSRPLVLRCIRDALVCLFMCPSSPLSFPSLPKCSQQFFFLPLVAFLSSFSPLSIPVFFFSLFPSFRAHNCIIERLFSQLTLFPLSPFCYIPDLSRLDTYTYVDPGTELYYLFISTAERNEKSNVGRHQGWVIR